MAAKKFKAGEILLAAGTVPEVAYRIQQGSVEVLQDSDGMAMPVAVLDRGQLVGAEELASGQAMADTIQALGLVIADEISKEQAMQLLGRRSPSAAKAVKPARASAKPGQD